jgi:hypothetical protein
MPTPRRVTDPDDELVQMNVRVPRSLRDAVDARRAELAALPRNKGHFSRDRWVTNALTNALTDRGAPPATSNGVGRTATPPHRRSRT